MKLYLLLAAFTAVTAIECRQGSISVSFNPGLMSRRNTINLSVVIAASSCKSDTGKPIDGLKITASGVGAGSCISNPGVPFSNSKFTVVTKDDSTGIGTMKSLFDTFTLSGKFNFGSFKERKLDITGKGIIDLISMGAACITSGVKNYDYTLENLSIKP